MKKRCRRRTPPSRFAQLLVESTPVFERRILESIQPTGWWSGCVTGPWSYNPEPAEG
jgi:hypothetical protein